MNERTQNQIATTLGITLGSYVERIASDYTNGRRGRVVELDNTKLRARVDWAGIRNFDGDPHKQLRTWVRFTDLRRVDALHVGTSL